MPTTQGFFTRKELKAGKQRTARTKVPSTVSVEQLHKSECRACPLNTACVSHPKMAPTGAAKPLVYVLGEAPGAKEDESGEQFVGPSGALLRSCFSKHTRKLIRFNNCIRTRPPDNRTPELIEVECCRPSVERDIEKSEPNVLIAVGAVALRWFLQRNVSIIGWRGRSFPWSIGDATFQVFPIVHPAYILRSRFGKGDIQGVELERVFRDDIVAAVNAAESREVQPVRAAPPFDVGVRRVWGSKSGDVRRVERFVDRLIDRGKVFTIDIETSALRPYDSENRLLLSFAIGTGSDVLSVGVDHKEVAWSKPERRAILAALVRLLSSSTPRIAHNAAFEIEWLVELFGTSVLGPRVMPGAVSVSGGHRTHPPTRKPIQGDSGRSGGGLWHDSMVQAYCLDERAIGQSLDDLCTIHFGLALKAESDVDRANLSALNIHDLLRYGGMDVKWTHKLYFRQRRLLKAQGLLKVYEMQRRRIPTVALTQRKGLHVDRGEVTRLRSEYEKAIVEIQAEIQQLPEVRKFVRSHGKFNPGSPPQLKLLLCDDLKRPEGWRGKKYSTDAEALGAMNGLRIAELVLALRTRKKLLSTYIESTDPQSVKSLVWSDGLIHTSFGTTFTVTGRLNSSGPNCQNFPKRKHVEIRRMIAAPEDHVFVSLDYGQIEARVLAMASGDVVLCDALEERYDIHMAWAKRIVDVYPKTIEKRYGKLTEDVALKKFRSDVKTYFVFPLFYGSLEESVGKALELPRKIAHGLFDEFWSSFRGVKEWQRELQRFYRKHGYVESLTGRRRRAPMSENMVLNTPIQGTASDIVLAAMDKLSLIAVEQNRPELQPILNIHDDLSFYLPGGSKDMCVTEILHCMLHPEFDWINVPISVEVSEGSNWCDLKEVGTYYSDEPLS